MSDVLRYHTVEALRALSLNELRALWELVPTDRQRAYRTAYDREVKTAGAEGSDAKERKIALALLKRYHESALVPIGLRWARAPKRVQVAAGRSREGAEREVNRLEITARLLPNEITAYGSMPVPSITVAPEVKVEPVITIEADDTTSDYDAAMGSRASMSGSENMLGGSK